MGPLDTLISGGTNYGEQTSIYRVPWSEFRRGCWRCVVPVVVAVCILGLLLYEVPENVAWRISEPALRRYMEGIIAAEKTKVPPTVIPTVYPSQWVGLYRIDHVTYFPDSHVVEFWIPDANNEGFAYSPVGVPAPRHIPWGLKYTEYWRWEGDWYRAAMTPLAVTQALRRHVEGNTATTWPFI